jgi:hypothetical protein
MDALGVIFIAAAMLAAPAAQDSAQPAGGACELHVWPGSGLGSVYHGWFHGGIVNGAVTGRDGYPQVPPNPIDTPAQRELLEAAQPQRLLQLDGHRLVMHDEALSSRVIRSTPGRIDPSASACYAELIVDDVMLQQDWVNGSFLRVSFRYRDFGAGQTPSRAFGTWVKAPLAGFSPKRPLDADKLPEEFRSAFARNISLFADALRKPAKKR